MRLQTSGVLLCILICIGLSSPSTAQSISGSGSKSLAKKSSSQAKDLKFAENLWNYLLSNNYKHWSPAPGKTANHFASQATGSMGSASPHGESAKIYVNRIAAGNPDDLPIGSILILENYRPDKSLETISVMYRTPGFNPSANDWYWVNYNADGSITSEKNRGSGPFGGNGIRQANATAPIKKMMGRSLGCIECHKSGGGVDLAFFNDRLKLQTGIAPLVNQPPKPVTPAFKPKLEIRPAAVIKQGQLQNFNIITNPESVIPQAP